MDNTNPLTFNCDNISSINPEYDFSQTGGGKFVVEMSADGSVSFTIRFGAVVDYQLELDKAHNNGELFMFLMNNYSDKTISHALRDLYDIGFPIEEWVVNYIQHITSKSDRYISMLQLLTTLRSFGEEDSQDTIF